MTKTKYTIAILLIIGLLLFNLYLYNGAEDKSFTTVMVVVVAIGLYKGITAPEFKDVFNLYRVNNLFKGPIRALEMVIAILLCVSSNYDSFTLLSEISLSNIILEIAYFVIFSFVLYRFFTLNLFREKVED